MRWFVIIGFALFACMLVYKFLPVVAATAFTVYGVSITWIMLIAVGLLYTGHRAVSKR